MKHLHRCAVSLRTCVLALCFLFIFAGGAALAAPLFGPKSYSTTTGKRQPFDETFTAVAENCATPAYTLVVTQGNPAVTSGSISVNGVEVVSENDFKKQVTSLEVSIEPRLGANSMHIELGGKPGASITVAVNRELDQPDGTPKKYAIVNGRLTIQDTISATPAAAYAIVVQNGDAAGHRVNSGSLRIGGVTVDLSAAATVRRRVGLQPSNSVDVDLRGSPGSFVTLQIMHVLESCGPQIEIIEPAEGSSITTDLIAVRGTLVAAPGAGVVVNDRAADIDWAHAGTSADPYRWFAFLSGTPGLTTLTAVATDPSSSTAQAGRHVSYDPSPSRIGLRAVPSSGVPPLEVTFTVDSTVDATAVRYELDLDGDGVFEKSFDSYPPRTDLIARFTDSGVRTPALRVRTSDGQLFTASTTVNVQPFAVIDGILRQQWARFTSALAASDIEGALASTDANARERYRPMLQLIRDHLQAYAAGITTIYPVWIQGNAAHYLVVRNESGRQAGYHVYFVRDAGGVWRIDQF